jgi:hypothetical protein
VVRPNRFRTLVMIRNLPPNAREQRAHPTRGRVRSDGPTVHERGGRGPRRERRRCLRTCAAALWRRVVSGSQPIRSVPHRHPRARSRASRAETARVALGVSHAARSALGRAARGVAEIDGEHGGELVELALGDLDTELTEASRAGVARRGSY